MNVIKDFDELVGLENDKYRIEGGSKYDERYVNAWIRPKDDTSDEYPHYLSTHTFYESQYRQSTRDLQKYGFDVQLESWG